MKRRDFSRSVRIEIVRRATVDNVIRCEQCGCAPRVWHIDHTNPDALQVDKSVPLTATDGQLLCAGSRDTCHGRKTAEQDVPAIAKAKRVEAKHLRVNKRIGPDAKLRSAPMPTTRKAAARASRGSKAPLARKLPPGFEPASSWQQRGLT